MCLRLPLPSQGLLRRCPGARRPHIEVCLFHPGLPSDIFLPQVRLVACFYSQHSRGLQGARHLHWGQVWPHSEGLLAEGGGSWLKSALLLPAE